MDKEKKQDELNPDALLNMLEDLERLKKRAEEGEAKFKLISQLTSDYFFEIAIRPNGSMEVIYISEDFTKLSGYTLKDIKNPKQWAKIASEEGFKNIINSFNSVLKGEKSEIDADLITKDKKKKFIHMISRPKYSGKKVVGIFGAVKDITEKKLTEEKYEIIFNNTINGLFFHDKNGNFIEVNKTAADMTGYTREELLKKKVFDIEVGLTKEKLFKIWPTVKEKQIILHGEHKRKDNSTYPVEVHLKKIKLGDRDLIFATVIDLSGKKE